MKASNVLMVAVTILLAPLTGSAEPSVQLESGGDLYAAGASLQVLQPVAGDAVLAGGSVLMTGDVALDVLAAGGSVNITGSVGDDLRVAGGTVTVTDRIEGDAFMAGGSVTLAATSTVGGNMWAAGGVVAVSAAIQGNMEVAGGKVSIGGRVYGDARVVAESLKIEPGAVITGTLYYKGSRPAVVDETAQIGEIVYTEKQFEGYGVSLLGGLIAALLVILGISLCTLVFAWLLPDVCRNAVNYVRARMLLSLVAGLATVILAPALGGILFALFLTAPLAIILFAAYVILLVTGTFIALTAFGSWLNEKFLGGREGTGGRALSILIAALAFVVVALIPVIGAIVVALAFCTGTGGLVLHGARLIRN